MRLKALSALSYDWRHGIITSSIREPNPIRQYLSRCVVVRCRWLPSEPRFCVVWKSRLSPAHDMGHV
ncbi:hypothetical protein J437_LFUL008774 [Ladona fulva]|uniref:Uncharacterized protein n=1 Tax=Ladona fulva TaxID=123851 RepID=A0A8K0NY97_LADFU|nr:hypothetical protein J437_LFUL008774 [Ladona fulva]